MLCNAGVKKVLKAVIENKIFNFREMAGASLANVAYLVIQSLLFIILTPMVLKALGDSLFGIWTIFLGIIGFAGLTNFRLSSTVMKFTSSTATQEKISIVVTFGYTSAFILGFITAIILWGARYYMAEEFLGNTASFSLLADTFALLALSIIPFFLSEISHGILLGLVHNNVSGALVTLHHLLLWCGALLVGCMGVDLRFLGLVILAVYISKFITSTAAVWFVLRSNQIKFHWDKTLVSEMMRYSMAVSLGGAGMLMFNSLDKVIIGIILGPTIAGAYGIGTSVALRLSMFADQLSQVIVPFSSGFHATGKKEQIVRLFRHSSSLVACSLALSAGILVLWMNPVLSLWISPEFSDKYFGLFSFLVGCYGIFSTFRSAHQISLGLGWVKVPNLILIGSAVIMLTCLWFLSRKFGLMGAIYANGVFTAVISINFYIGHRLDIEPRFVLEDIKYPILVIVACVVFSWSNPANIFKIFGTAVLIFAILLIAFRDVGKEALSKLIRISGRD